MSLRGLRWFRPGGEALALACYLSLYAPWFILVEADLAVPLMEGFWRLALLFTLAFVSARLGRTPLKRLSLPVQRCLSVAWTLAGIALAVIVVVMPAARISPIPHHYLWALIALGAWLRGLYMGASGSDNMQMQRQLVLGAAGVALFLALAQHLGFWEVVTGRAVPFLLFWLVGILVATALTRLEELQDRIGRQSDVLARSWPPLLLALAGAMLALAVLLSMLAPRLALFLQWLLRLLWNITLEVLRLLAHVVGYLVQLLILLFMWLLSRGAEQEYQPPGYAPGGDIIPESPELGLLSPLFVEYLKWFGLIAVVLIVAALSVYILLRAWPKRAAAATEEFRESFASAGALRRWAAQRWQELAGGLRRRAARRFAALHRPPPASAVEIYHALLRLAARRGCARPRSTTPGQFQPRLRACFPGERQDLERFLSAFILEFYGEQPTSPELRRELILLWEDFRRRASAAAKEAP